MRLIDTWELMRWVGPIEAALAILPADLSLDGCDLNALAPALRALFYACRMDNFKLAKITKILCLKRPLLLPILDSRVLEALDRGAGPNDPDAFAEHSVEVLRRFQLLMNHGDNLAAIHAATAAINQDLSDGGPGRGPGPVVRLSAIRVLETLIWFDWGGARDFGWTLNAEETAFVRHDEPPAEAEAAPGA